MLSLRLLHVLVVVVGFLGPTTVAWVASPSASRSRFCAGDRGNHPRSLQLPTSGKVSFSRPPQSEHHPRFASTSHSNESNEHERDDDDDDESTTTTSTNIDTKQTTAIATTKSDPTKRTNDIISSSLLPFSLSSLLPQTPQQKKVANGVVLVLAFGYALYTILSIDVGMTRGWSAPEIAMRIPLDNWGAYESTLANKPILTKSLINVVIYLLGDWLSQTAFQNKPLLDFELDRTLRNGLIGLCFGPLVHSYYEFSDWILPTQNGLLTKLQKILMDQTIYLTVKCSMYIAAVGLLAGEDPESVKETVTDRLGGVVATAWKFWPIVHCVTYSVIPAQHRVLWVNSVDLVWNAILSSAAQTVDDGVVEGSGPESSAATPATTNNNNNAKKNELFVPPVVTTAAMAPLWSFDEKFATTENLGGNTNTTAVLVGT